MTQPVTVRGVRTSSSRMLAVLVVVAAPACGRARYLRAEDSGRVIDAAASDTGAIDGGSFDAMRSDTGASDSGASDTGMSDTGAADAGRDAGPDATTPSACGGPAVLDADGNSYRTITVGLQCWLASNLHVGVRVPSAAGQSNNGMVERYCYGDAASCTDAALYTWDEAMNYVDVSGARGICPVGWHIPSDLDWQALERFLGMSDSDIAMFDFRGTTQGTALLSGGASGLNVPTVGILADTGAFFGGGTEAFVWASDSALAGANAFSRRLTSGNPQVQRYGYAQTSAFSVRCIQD